MTTKRKRTGIAVLTIPLLEYVLLETVFFHPHGMKDWPLVLCVFGEAVILVSLLRKRVILPWGTALGYFFAFGIGVLFQKDYADPSGARTLNNLWILWAIAYLVIIGLGILMEIGKTKYGLYRR